MEFVGVSKARGINEGGFIGVAYELGNEVYRLSTPVYCEGEGKLNHDITVIEDDINVYKKSNGSYVYSVK